MSYHEWTNPADEWLGPDPEGDPYRQLAELRTRLNDHLNAECEWESRH